MYVKLKYCSITKVESIKIISKTLFLRLKKVLHIVIDHKQTTLLEGY